jgi:WD40 repeat protein
LFLDTLEQERSFDDCIKDPATVINECHKGGVLCIAVANRDSGDSFVCTGGADHDVKIWDFVSPAVSGDEKFKQLRGDRDSNLQDLKDLFSSGDSGLHLHLRNYCLEVRNSQEIRIISTFKCVLYADFLNYCRLMCVQSSRDITDRFSR